MMMFHRAKKTERGAALLSVLLIVSAMSVAALVALDAVSRSVVLAKTSTARTQAMWHVNSAEAFAKIAIQDILEPLDHKLIAGMPGLDEPIVFDLEGGLLMTVISDRTNCFNLNALVKTDEQGTRIADKPMLSRYRILLVASGIFDSDADALVDTLADWLDSDTFSRTRGAEDGYYIGLAPPYRTSGEMLENMSELRAVLGYSDEVIDQIAPFICVRPTAEESTLNLNMLTTEDAHLLSAIFSRQLEPKPARELIEQRPIGGWGSKGEFLQHPAIQAISPQYKRAERISVQSSFFEMEGNVTYGAEVAEFEIHFAAEPGNRPETVWRRYGGE